MRDVYIPDGSAMLGAFAAGQRMRQQRQELADEQARREATRGIGAAMASGDYAGAARLAYDTGDLQTGLSLQTRGDQIRKDARKREIITQSKTDPKKAAEDALAEGDFDLYDDLRKVTDDAEKQRYGAFAVVLRSIAQNEPDQWDDLIAANRGQLEGLGVPAQEIDAFIQASPEQRTGMMALMLQRADQFDKFQTEQKDRRDFTATQADRAADNKRADDQLAISRAQLGVAQGNLALSRQREGRMAKGGSSGDGNWEEF
jgi:hypothetical protein